MLRGPDSPAEVVPLIRAEEEAWPLAGAVQQTGIISQYILQPGHHVSSLPGLTKAQAWIIPFGAHTAPARVGPPGTRALAGFKRADSGPLLCIPAV